MNTDGQHLDQRHCKPVTEATYWALPRLVSSEFSALYIYIDVQQINTEQRKKKTQRTHKNSQSLVHPAAENWSFLANKPVHGCYKLHECTVGKVTELLKKNKQWSDSHPRWYLESRDTRCLVPRYSNFGVETLQLGRSCILCSNGLLWGMRPYQRLQT